MTSRVRSHHVPERFLRQLWKHLHFDTTNLRSTDGRAIEILSPGKLNRDGGPDFLDAQIRIGAVLQRGHVELHQYQDEWLAHRHDKDPKYNAVILHVVLQGKPGAPAETESRRTIPVLVLHDFITGTYRETWGRMILDERAERLSSIKCSSLNESVDAATIRELLEKLAIERIELKVRRFEERLRELAGEGRLSIQEPALRYEEIPFGVNPEDLPPPVAEFTKRDFSPRHLWEQLLYEGIMEALGYAKNQQPFLKLARNLKFRSLQEYCSSEHTNGVPMSLESMLFGVAGLLHPQNGQADKESRRHLKQLGNLWRGYRQFYHGECVSEADWQFFRLRPENFPTIRLAGAARLIPKLVRKNFFKFIIQIIKSESLTNEEQYRILQSLFIVPAGDFWTHHFRFGEEAKAPVSTLIGRSRADEIMLNAVIPVALLYARIFNEPAVRRESLKLYQQGVPMSANSVRSIIELQLVRKKFDLDSALLQQGALQLYKFYCVEERCAECAVGRRVFRGDA